MDRDLRAAAERRLAAIVVNRGAERRGRREALLHGPPRVLAVEAEQALEQLPPVEHVQLELSHAGPRALVGGLLRGEVQLGDVARLEEGARRVASPGGWRARAMREPWR